MPLTLLMNKLTPLKRGELILTQTTVMKTLVETLNSIWPTSSWLYTLIISTRFESLDRHVPQIINCNVSPQQEQDSTQLPPSARTIWKQARNAAIEAAKMSERTEWFKEAIARGLLEPWAAGLEKVPQFAQKRELMDKIQNIRRRAALDVMRATERFLRQEHERLTTISGGHLTTVSGMVRRAHPDDPGAPAPIISRATQAITIATDRERVREFRSLEERSRSLNQSCPTNNEIADPATARVRNQPRDNDAHFRGRGGRGGRHPRGRRPGRPYPRKRGEHHDA